MYKIDLTYFKKSGKYYSSGCYYTNKEQMYHVFNEVKEMLENGKWPDLVDGINEFYVSVSSDEHPNAYPCLITQFVN